MGGSPKGLHIVGRQRIIDRVATALRHACDELLLAANDAAAASWLPGTAVVADLHRGAGGLAGVEAAMRSAGSVVVVAWDMPFVPGTLISELVRVGNAASAAVVIPESDSPYGFEPFCAYYDARILPALGAFLERGGGAARDFLAGVEPVHRITLAEVASFGDPKTIFLSVNSADDLTAARTIAARSG
jgi:molybdopterin-guanine dinucleotide biosynthesis protein A